MPAGIGSAQEESSEQLATELPGADDEGRLQFDLAARYYRTGRFELAGRTFEAAHAVSHHPELLFNAYIAYRDGSLFADALRTLRAYVPSIEEPVLLAANQARLASLEELVARLETPAATEVVLSPAAIETNASVAVAAPETPPNEVSHAVAPWILVASGAALSVASIGPGLAALRAESTLDEGCDTTGCPSDLQDTMDRGRRLQRTTDAMWITGAVVGVAGLVWVLIDRLRSSDDDHASIPMGVRF